jgi:hypothetical protein
MKNGNFSSFTRVRIVKSTVVVVKHDSKNKKKEAASDLKRRGN